MYLGGFDEIEEPEFVVVTGETYPRLLIISEY
jgi:hypothetical protein